ncbi:MAG: hypothetical protein JXL81_12130 [Deltaproteobacteria bacterium]|nr:hypothetical protein [Deltaproteobacteria bacterium]
MKKFVGIMIMLLGAIMFVAGSASAFDMDEHVSQAANGKGDVVIFPNYVAVGGWDTKLVVTNTSFTHSVVAKVVVRGAKWSQELLDFFIYLSPADVWVGHLNWGPNGPRMWSVDGSCRGGSRAGFSGWASESNPWNCTLSQVCTDVISLGYVEVFEAWNGIIVDSSGPVARPVPKPLIKAAYDAATSSTDFEGVINSLTGHYEISFGHYPVAGVSGIPATSMFAADRATVLRNYNITDKLTFVETFFGGLNSRNSLCEVEAALSKNGLQMPYYALENPLSTLHLFNFPTKLTVLADCLFDGVRSPYFAQNGEYGCIEYGAKFIDLEENSTTTGELPSPIPEEEKDVFCWELDFIDFALAKMADYVYDEGWAHYQFEETTSCLSRADGSIGYDGVPVIAKSIIMKPGKFMSIIPAAFSDGKVEYGAVEIIDYQWEYAAPGKLPTDYQD